MKIMRKNNWDFIKEERRKQNINMRSDKEYQQILIGMLLKISEDKRIQNQVKKVKRIIK